MDQVVSSYISTFPRQKIARKLKTEEWGIENIQAGMRLKNLYSNSRRSSGAKKIRNYDLFNGKFNKADLGYELNPIIGKDYTFPAELQYRDIVTPIFQTLFGEEIKRGFNFVCRAVNDDAISSKEQLQQKAVLESLQQRLAHSIMSPEEQKQVQQGQTPEEIQKYFTYSYQDMRERIATHLVTYYRKFLRLDQVFQKGWEDALLAGEEIYKIQTRANEPFVGRVNPIECHYLLPHNSDLIDDATIVLEQTFMSIGKVIDQFYDDLTPTQIDKLEDYLEDRQFLREGTFELPARQFISTEEELLDKGLMLNNDYFDPHGNIMINYVTWQSMRKVGILQYMDDNGEQQETMVDEEFKMPKDNPDMSIEWKWINEYWEGTKIGLDIYINIRPKKLQFRSMDNISKCKSGYVGTVYNCNNSQSVSLMDRLVPWAYFYTVILYRFELLIAANQGRIAKIDLSMVPDGWEIDKWLHYATVVKFAFVNSFNEGKKGSATGKLAGNMNVQSGEINLETGAAIQGLVQTLEFIEQKIYQVAGVPPQRIGEVQASEGVGNVQQVMQSSSTVTEPYFQNHNWAKQRVLECLVEVAKDCLAGKSKKLQYVTDDLASVFFEVDGNEFSNAEYGIFVSNSSKDAQVLEALKELTHAALQNDKIEMSTVVDMLMSESIAEIKNKIKQSEQNLSKNQQAQEQAQMDHEKKMHDEKLSDGQILRDWQSNENDKNNQTKIDVATITSLGMAKNTSADLDDSGVPDIVELNKHLDKMDIERRKVALEGQRLKQEDKHHQDNLKVEKSKEKVKVEVAKIGLRKKNQNKTKKK